MDEDREQLTREELVAWIRKLRAGIRHLSPCLSEEGWLSRTLHAFPNSNQLRRRSIRFFCASISSRAFVIVGYATSPARRSTVPDRKTEKRLRMRDDTPPPQPLKQGYRDCGRLELSVTTECVVRKCRNARSSVRTDSFLWMKCGDCSLLQKNLYARSCSLRL